MTKILHLPLGVLLLVIAACGGGDSENEGQPASGRSRAAEAPPWGTGEHNY